jgi:UDP-glucose 4-epimerase
MKCLVTGCAGFIGSNLVDKLLELGHEVLGIDNLSTGQYRFLENAIRDTSFRFIEADLKSPEQYYPAFLGVDAVFHFAANADVRFGTNNPRRDLDENTIATFNVLEGMRAYGVEHILFSSTGSVYGEASVIPTPEDGPFPVQTSLYGASKLACEGLIAAYCEGFGMRSWIFRFVSILGERYTHGHVFDFYKMLKSEPSRLPVLGNGKQKKSYLYVQDCLDAILIAHQKAKHKVNVFNLGVDSYCEVDDSIRWIIESLNVTPVLEYSGGDRGWIGDNPFIFLDCNRIRSLGWKPKHSIRDGVLRTVEYLRANEWVFEQRA